ncbi:MAG: outer membrane beta-barrel family protein [Bacteroidales bacterium]
MRLRIFTLTILIFLITSGFAADIKGLVVDVNTKERIGYATVVISDSLRQMKNMTVVAADDGHFSFAGVRHGNYNLKASFVGYNDLVVNVNVPNENSIVNLQELGLKSTLNALDEVNVVGQKSQMRLEIDRKVFDVDQNIASDGASASDVLQNIPSVAVDQEGKISLRNNPNVDLWINGKPSGLTGDSRAQYLEQLPAGSVQTIEVITNPSSKYSAEGSAGAINLVLKKGLKKGYFGGVTASADTWGGAGVSGNYNLTTNKVDLGLNAGARYSQWLFYNDMCRRSWQGNDTTVMNQYNDSNYKNWQFMLRANLAYHITDKDEIEFTGAAMPGIPSGNTSMVSSDGMGMTTRDRVAKESGLFSLYMAKVDYTHKFSEANSLRIYGSYRNYSGDTKTKFSQLALNVFSAQKQDDVGRVYAGDLQIDYSNQINKIFKIESGLSGLWGNIINDVNTFQGGDMDNMNPAPGLNYNYNELFNVYALYVTFSGKVKGFGFLAGLRGENMNYKTVSRPYSEQAPDAKHNYFRLFPSVFLSYSLPKNNEIQLNYTSRVNYPSDMTLNPFHQITDSTTISYGNPSIKPEYSQSVELNYIKNWDDHTLSASAYYRFTDGVVQQVSYYESPVMYYTYENVTRQQNVGVEVVAKNKLFKILNLTTTLNLYYQKQNPFDFVYVSNAGVKSVMHYDENSNFTWTLRVMASLILPKDISFQVSGEYNAKQVLVQGSVLPSYALDLGLRKGFLNKKLFVSIAGRNILNSRSWTRETYGDNFSQNMKWIYGKWQLRFSVSYYFGKNAKNKNVPQQQDIINSGDGGMDGGKGGM